jgi:glycosyltransferase involved in cell wall biosynthesis
MRILIDGRMLSWTGIGRYTRALLEELEAIDQTNQYLVLVRKHDWGRWAPRADNFTRVECDIAPYSLAEQARLPRIIDRLTPDVVHLVTSNAAARYRGRKVVTVADLTLLDFDTSRGSLGRRLATKLKRFPFLLIFRRQVTTATHIVTLTEYVRDQLVERFRVDRRNVSPIWLAADSDHLNAAEEERVAGLDTPGRFLLYVGNYYPYKNVRLLIEALALVSKTRPDAKLVLAGKLDEFKDGLLSIARTLAVSDRVVMPGFVTDGQLTWLYRNASMYVNPSLSEGFGLQGLEAMAQGLPVLSSTASCLPEVYGDAALYFDPYSADDLAKKITELLERPGLSTDLAARGRERLALFSWRKTAEVTHQVYLDVGQQMLARARRP